MCRGPFGRTSVVSSSTQEAMERREVNAEEQMFAKQSAFEQEAHMSHEASFPQLWTHGQYLCGPWFSTQFGSSQPCAHATCMENILKYFDFNVTRDTRDGQLSPSDSTSRISDVRGRDGEKHLHPYNHYKENCGTKSKKNCNVRPIEIVCLPRGGTAEPNEIFTWQIQ